MISPSLDAVREVKPVPGRHGEATLSNDLRLEVSRRRLKTLMDRFGVS
jgi:DNA-binding LytR/AlgR family response regulator